MQLADFYPQRRPDGTWGNELEANSVITCMDATSRPTAAEQAALTAELASIAPLNYPEGSFSVSMCDALPTAGDEPVTINGEGAPPLLVIGNTGDPATPFTSTQRMVAVLESAVLIAVESNNHGGYGTNDCVDEAVHRYLIESNVPAMEIAGPYLDRVLGLLHRGWCCRRRPWPPSTGMPSVPGPCWPSPTMPASCARTGVSSACPRSISHRRSCR